MHRKLLTMDGNEGFICFETRSLPPLTHVLPPIFDLSVLPIYVARVPRGSIHSLLPFAVRQLPDRSSH
jgi:hypothetical protein